MKEKYLKDIKIAILCEDCKRIQDISIKTGIRHETVKNIIKIFETVGVVEKIEDFYIWNSISYKFFNDYKERKDKYILSLENRLFELRMHKIGVNGENHDD